MSAVEGDTENGFDLDNAPTPDALDLGMNGGAGSEDDGDLFGSDDEDQKNEYVEATCRLSATDRIQHQSKT
jgi:hypothetical protein